MGCTLNGRVLRKLFLVFLCYCRVNFVASNEFYLKFKLINKIFVSLIENQTFLSHSIRFQSSYNFTHSVSISLLNQLIII